MHRPLSAAYLERKLRAITGVQGSNPLPDLADLQGMMVIENDRPEWRFPGGEYLWGIHRQVAAGGAGTFAYVAVRVPLGAGIVSVVKKIVIANNTLATQFLSIGMGQNVAVLNDGIVFPRDSRNLQEIPGTRRDTGTPAAALGVNELVRVDVLAGTTVELDVEYVLVASQANQGPGIYVQDFGAGNAAINVAFAGYERPLEGEQEIR